MTIPSTRTNENGHIHISKKICTGCGLCVSGCPDRSLCMQNGKAAVAADPVFGCFACGHCMAVCPVEAIQVTGRTLSPTDIFPLPDRAASATYAQLLALMQQRRSVREFTNQPVSPEHIEQIVRVARSAPMGIPPSEVRLLILDSREKVRRFSQEACTLMEKATWMATPWFLALMRPLWGKEKDAMFRHFIGPLIKTYREHMREGLDVILYDAPLAMYFYGSPYSDADQMINATYAMLAGEALGLGSCMIGAVHPFLQFGPGAKQLRELYGIQHTSKTGLVVIFGHPKKRYLRGINRTLAAVHHVP